MNLIDKMLGGRSGVLSLALLASALTLAGGARADAGKQKLDSSLLKALSVKKSSVKDVRQGIIVQTDGAITPAMEKQFKALGGEIGARYTILQGFNGSIRLSKLEELAKLPWVKRVSGDLTVQRSSRAKATLKDVKGKDAPNGTKSVQPAPQVDSETGTTVSPGMVPANWSD